MIICLIVKIQQGNHLQLQANVPSGSSSIDFGIHPPPEDHQPFPVRHVQPPPLKHATLTSFNVFFRLLAVICAVPAGLVIKRSFIIHLDPAKDLALYLIHTLLLGSDM